MFNSLARTILQSNTGIIGRPLAICRPESSREKSPKCAQARPWEPTSGAHSHEFTPQFSITKLAFALPYFGDEGVVNLFKRDKKYLPSFSRQYLARMFIPFECTCSKIVCCAAGVCVRRALDRSTCRLRHTPLAELHYRRYTDFF